MEKIKNKETKVAVTNSLNDRDCLMDVLETIKNMHVNLAIALNEASNDNIHKELMTIIDDVSFMQRSLFDLAFIKGWYVLEASKESKISETLSKLVKSYEELC